MSAEQTPDIAAVLAGHEGYVWQRSRGGWTCRCDAPLTPPHESAGEWDAKPAWVAHVAAALAAAVREARAAELRRAADEHEAELVCCDIFERLRDKPSKFWTDNERAAYQHHAICYWGAACAEGDRDRADRITEPATMSSAECRCPDDCDCDGRFACEATTPPPSTHVCELPVGHDGWHHAGACNWERDHRRIAEPVSHEQDA